MVFNDRSVVDGGIPMVPRLILSDSVGKFGDAALRSGIKIEEKSFCVY
jgi:hypothetical protein